VQVAKLPENTKIQEGGLPSIPTEQNRKTEEIEAGGGAQEELMGH